MGLARGARGHAFELSEAFGAWRVVAHDRSWQLDLMALEGATIEQDLRRRDLTVNAIAEPLGGGDHVDPFGGIEDLDARILRAVSGAAFLDDPLRVMRLARLACELDFEIELGTAEAARAVAPRLTAVSPERVFEELKRLICADRAPEGIGLLGSLGATAAVLPELAALDGVDQSRFHHLDVLGHTRQVLAQTIEITENPVLLYEGEEQAAALRALLDAPFANGLSRGQAMRFGALLHDIAKPQTRDVTDEGRVTFMGHDRAGAELGASILRRLRASEKLCAHVAALTLHHLRLGFLVHRVPLSRRDVYDYLLSCSPVGVDVTLLSVADRLATRGDNAEQRDRQARRAGAHDAARGAGLGGEPAASAGPRRRAGAGARDQAGPARRRAAGRAAGGGVQRRGPHARAGDRPGAGAGREHGRRSISCAAMRDPDCLFCKIIAGELPSQQVDCRRANGRVHGHQPGDARPRAGRPAQPRDRPAGGRSRGRRRRRGRRATAGRTSGASGSARTAST